MSMSSSNGSPSPSKFSSAEKRAVHNALERKRRDHIKDMFCQLKDSVPNMAGEKISTKASRAQILKKACDYIQLMRKKNAMSAKDLEELAHQVLRTRRQITKLESLRATNRYVDTLPAIPPSNESSHTSLSAPPAASPSLALTGMYPRITQDDGGYGLASLRVPGPMGLSAIMSLNMPGLGGAFPMVSAMEGYSGLAQIPASLVGPQRVYVSEQSFPPVETEPRTTLPSDQNDPM